MGKVHWRRGLCAGAPRVQAALRARNPTTCPRYEPRMRAQLAHVITASGSLAAIPSLDGLTDEERKQVERELDGDG